MSGREEISLLEVEKHNTSDDCWIVIGNRVFDVTEFLSSHPGGVNVILQEAGKIATKSLERFHSPDIVDSLPKESFIGFLDPNDVDTNIDNSADFTRNDTEKPPLDALLNVFEFEAVAKQVMTPLGYGYYASAGGDEITARENRSALHRIFLKPRVLVNVSSVDPSTSILGFSSSFPLFICPTALGKLAHPDGEVNLTRAASNQGIIQIVSTLSSCGLSEIAAAKTKQQIVWYQLYVHGKRDITENMVRKAEELGCSAICITVDTAVIGRRERDMRQKFNATLKPNAMDAKALTSPSSLNQGVAKALSSYFDPSFCWGDIAWLKSITSLPLILKGIQCADDALLAVQHGVRAIMISNHGGRQLDFVRGSVEILDEVMSALRAHHLDDRIEVYVDGGIRRGTDIFKCIALGAKAVGIGRPTLYGMAAYGQEGAEKVISILRGEFETTMKLMGTITIADIRPHLLASKNLHEHITLVPKNYLSASIYQKMTLLGKL